MGQRQLVAFAKPRLGFRFGPRQRFGFRFGRDHQQRFESSGGSSSGSYNQDVFASGFGVMAYAGYNSTGSRFDGGWAWGEGWSGVAGTARGPSAYSGVGYAFTPGAAVSVADLADQSNTEGHQVALQMQATDWAAGSGAAAASGSASAPTYAALGLPDGLAIDPSTGLISGTIQAGDAADGPYVVTVTFTDADGSASQTFLWTVADPVTVRPPSTSPASRAVRFPWPMTGADANGAALDLERDRPARRPGHQPPRAA